MATKHTQEHNLFFDPEDLRWATPEIVADYRAARLQGKTIVDLGCGIGFQTIAFAKRCQKVYAIDIDAKKIDYAKKNAAVLGVKNIEFIRGDMLDPAIVQKIPQADIVFCDPERLAEEKERTIQSIIPDVHKIIETYSKITTNLAIEFPPQMKIIPFDCEKEYLSLHGNLNRLTLYFGSLQTAERSAIVLPENEKLVLDKKSRLETTKALRKYLLEADPAVVKADLLAELSTTTKTVLYSKNKAVFFTADKKVNSPFFKNVVEVVGQTTEEKEIFSLLQKCDAGKVLIRYPVPPQEYWTIRSKLEKGLTGTKKASLFKFGELFVIGSD